VFLLLYDCDNSQQYWNSSQDFTEKKKKVNVSLNRDYGLDTIIRLTCVSMYNKDTCTVIEKAKLTEQQVIYLNRSKQKIWANSICHKRFQLLWHFGKASRIAAFWRNFRQMKNNYSTSTVLVQESISNKIWNKKHLFPLKPVYGILR
jgi:hypothetical protein